MANPLNNPFFQKEPAMKQFTPIILLAFIALLANGCVSRTTTSKRGYGTDFSEKKTVWIWQKEYRDPK
jgi:hypothetical protein